MKRVPTLHTMGPKVTFYLKYFTPWVLCVDGWVLFNMYQWLHCAWRGCCIKGCAFLYTECSILALF